MTERQKRVRKIKITIDRAKKLQLILFPSKVEDADAIYITAWGKKSNTGVLNTILNVMCPEEFNPDD